VAWLFDKVIPIDDRNGSLPRPNFAVWIVLNLTVVACWLAASEAPAPPPFPDAIAAAAFVFAALNLLLLGAAYWALRESVDVMNGETPASGRKFAETSTSRSAVFFGGTAGLLIAQLAVAIAWTQDTQHVALIATDDAIAPRYLNFLVAIVDALPLASAYVTPLSGHVSFAAGPWGMALHRGLNGLGSILIVTTAIGFVQQRIAFRRMVDSLVNAPGEGFPPALRERFKNAPAAIKSYVLSAFRNESNDAKRLRLAQLAVDRQSYSFPKVFAAAYPDLGDGCREQGSLLIAAFLEDKQHTFYPATLLGLLDACERGQRNGGFRVADRRRIARFLVPALERLAPIDGTATAARIQTVMAQKVLCSAVTGEVPPPLSRRAASLLISVNSYQAIPYLLRGVRKFDDSLSLKVLGWAAKMLGNRGLIFSPSRNLSLLSRMAAAEREARRNRDLSPAVVAGLARVREKIETRLKAANAAAEKKKNPRPARGRHARPHQPDASQVQPIAIAVAAEQASAQ
jgi:hypothetical protein